MAEAKKEVFDEEVVDDDLLDNDVDYGDKSTSFDGDSSSVNSGGSSPSVNSRRSSSELELTDAQKAELLEIRKMMLEDLLIENIESKEAQAGADKLEECDNKKNIEELVSKAREICKKKLEDKLDALS